MVFHHDDGTKKFESDMRNLSNRRLSSIEAEAEKCQSHCSRRNNNLSPRTE